MKTSQRFHKKCPITHKQYLQNNIQYKNTRTKTLCWSSEYIPSLAYCCSFNDLRSNFLLWFDILLRTVGLTDCMIRVNSNRMCFEIIIEHSHRRKNKQMLLSPHLHNARLLVRIQTFATIKMWVFNAINCLKPNMHRLLYPMHRHPLLRKIDVQNLIDVEL